MAKTLYTFQADLKELERLNKLFKEATKELKAMEKGTKNTKKGLEDKKKSVDKLNNSLETTKNKARGVVDSTNKVTGAGRNMANVFKSAAVAIAAAFTVRAIAGGIRGMMSVFKEFESRMAAVKAISGATDEQFKELNESALELGRTTVFSAAQVAALQEEYARLGFTTEEILKAQEATIDLAAATGEDLGSAAATAGSVLRAFGYEATQTQRIVDTMAESFTGSALNLERFTESMKFVAPIARNVGFTVEETTSMLMKLADAGLTGSIAGNALKNIFLDLGNANSKLSKSIGGPVNSLEELVVKLKELKEDSFGATQAAELLNKRATPAFLQLIESADGLEELSLQLSLADGAAREMAAIRLDTLEGDLVLMKSAMEGLGIALADTFDVTLRQIVDSFTRFLQSFADSEGALKTFRTTVQILSTALTAYVVAMGSVKAITLATTGLTKIWNAVKSASIVIYATARHGALGYGVTMGILSARLKAATGKATMFKAVLASTPWGLLAVGLGTAIAMFTDFGDELDSTELKQNRVNRAFNKSMQELSQLTEGTKEYNDAVVKLTKDYSPYLKNIDLEIKTKKELLAIESELLQVTDGRGNLIVDELTELENLHENYDKYAASIKVHAEKIFAFITDMSAKQPDHPINELLKFVPPDDADTDAIIAHFQEFVNEMNAFEITTAAGDTVWDGEENVEGLGGSILKSADFTWDALKQVRPMFEEGGELSEYFNLVKETFDSGADIWLDISQRGFDIEQHGFKGFGDVDLTTLMPNIKLLGTEDFFSNITLPSLEDLEKQIIALGGKIDDTVGQEVVDEFKTVRQQVRTDYLADLNTFRKMKDQAAQEDQLALIQQLTTTAELTSRYLEIVAENEKEGGEESTAAKNFLERQRDKGQAILDFMNLYNNVWTDTAGNLLNIKQTIGIETTELQRHLEDLENNIIKSNKSVKKIENDSFKFRLNKTKDFYKQMMKLQSKMFEDDISRQLAQADATIRIETEKLESELALNEANATEIERIRGRIISGKEAGKFIKANRKNFEVLKTLSFDVLKALEQGQKEVIDEITGEKYTLSGVLEEMIKEEQTKAKNNKHYLRLLEFQHQSDIAKIKQQALEQSLRLEQKLISQSNALRLTSVDYFSGNYGVFKKEAEDFYATEVKLINQNAELMKNLRFEQELSLLGTDLAQTMNPEQYADFFNTMEDMQKELIVNGEVVMKDGSAVMVADFDRQLKYAREIHRQTEGTYADTETIKQNTDDAITHIDNQTKSDLLTSEQNFQSTKADLMQNEIQMYAQLYSQVFSMFDSYLQNVEDRERQSIDDRYDKILEDQDRRMERELEVAEQTGADQEAIRKKYELLTKGAEKQRENEQKAIDQKAFERKKFNDIASVIMNTAVALSRNFAELTFFGALAANPVLLALMAAQIGLISAQKFVGAKGGLIPQFGGGGMVHGPSHANGGVKYNAGGRVVELEGGEAVINKRSTAMFHNQLSAMNVAGGGKSFAAGGITPGTSNMLGSVNGNQDLSLLAETIVSGINTQRVIISEASITETQNRVSVSEANSTLFN